MFVIYKTLYFRHFIDKKAYIYFTMLLNFYHTYQELNSSYYEVDNIREIAFKYINRDMPELPPKTFEFRNLTYLRIERCNVSQLSSSIGMLSLLEHLTISHTLIESLPDEMCLLTKLKNIDLSNNVLLKRLPHKINDLRSVSQINLTEDDQLPSTFIVRQTRQRECKKTTNSMKTQDLLQYISDYYYKPVSYATMTILLMNFRRTDAKSVWSWIPKDVARIIARMVFESVKSPEWDKVNRKKLRITRRTVSKK